MLQKGETMKKKDAKLVLDRDSLEYISAVIQWLEDTGGIYSKDLTINSLNIETTDGKVFCQVVRKDNGSWRTVFDKE